LSIDSTTLEIDGTELKVVAGAAGGVSDVTVDYTGRTVPCTLPITVSEPSTGTKQINIPDNSNAFGAKYVQDSEPTGSTICDGDLWYDTSTSGSAGNLTLTGSSANTLVTVTGVNAIQGESNLTWDGGELKADHAAGEVRIHPADGSIEIARVAGSPFIDFKDNKSDDYDVRIQQNADPGLLIYAPGPTPGTTSAATLSATGNITAFASDDRLKTNKVNISNAVDKVNSLNGFTFNFNETGASLGFDKEITHAGVSAQEVAKVLPEAVKPAPVNSEYKTVQYEKLVPLLIEAIKELTDKVKELENK